MWGNPYCVYVLFNQLAETVNSQLIDEGEVSVCKTTIFYHRLRERHQDVLRQKLFKLKQEQGVESEPLFPIIKEELRSEDDE